MSNVGSPSTSALQVSVLIPTYRDAHFLRKSLPAVLDNPHAEIEIIILNNDPGQDVRKLIGESAAGDSRLRIVEMGESHFTRAINRGIRESTGDLVMFYNADLFPSSMYIAEMVSFFVVHPQAGAAIGKLLRYDIERYEPTDVIDSAGLVLTRQRRLMARGEGERDDGRFDTASEMFAIDGAAMVVRRVARTRSASLASISTRISSRTRRITTFRGACAWQGGTAGTTLAPWHTTVARREALDRGHIGLQSAASTFSSERSRTTSEPMR